MTSPQADVLRRVAEVLDRVHAAGPLPEELYITVAWTYPDIQVTRHAALTDHERMRVADRLAYAAGVKLYVRSTDPASDPPSWTYGTAYGSGDWLGIYVPDITSVEEPPPVSEQ